MFQKLQSRLIHGLRGLEKFTRTDMVYVAKGGFWLSLGYILSVLVSLGLIIAFANLLSPELYGNYKFILSGMGIIGAFSLTGLGSAIIQSTSRGFVNSLARGFRAQIRWSTLPILIGIGVAGYYYLNDNLLLAGGFLLVGICFPIIQSFSLYEATLVGLRKFKRRTLLNVTQQIINAGALIIALFLTNNVIVLLFVYIGTFLVTSSVFYTITQRSLVPAPEQDTKLVSNAIHLTIMKGIVKLATELDKILIFHYLGAVELAMYAFALAPVNKINSLNSVVRNITLPKLAVRDLPTLKQTLPRKIGFVMFGSAVIAIAYYFAAPYLFWWVFPEYVDGIRLTQTFAAFLVFSIPASIMTQTMIAHMKKRSLYIGQILPPVIRIIFVAVLVSQFGMWGAVFALIGSEIVNFITLSVLFKYLR